MGNLTPDRANRLLGGVVALENPIKLGDTQKLPDIIIGSNQNEIASVVKAHFKRRNQLSESGRVHELNIRKIDYEGVEAGVDLPVDALSEA